MTITTIISVLTILLLIISAFLSASETALFSIPKERIHFFKTNDKKSFQLVYSLLQNGQATLLMIILGNIFLNITIAGLINSLLNRFFSGNSSLLSLFTATLIIVLFGEMIPKNAALKNNESIAVLIAPFLCNIIKIFNPVLSSIQKINQFFLRIFKGHFQNPSPFVTIEELKSGFLKSAMSGAISNDEQSLISEILDLGAQPVRRLVIHRSRLVILAENTSVKIARNTLGEKKQSFALLRSRKDSRQISGIVYLRDLICAEAQMAVLVLSRPPVWIPETMEIADLISYLFNEGHSEACVLDEFGGFSGIFSLSSTLNDLIFDATHKKETGKLNNSEVLTKIFSGVHEIEDIDDWIPDSLKTISSEIRTINGLITNYLGRIPKTGDRFAIDGWNFYIIGANPTRIDSILIHKRKTNANEC